MSAFAYGHAVPALAFDGRTDKERISGGILGQTCGLPVNVFAVMDDCMVNGGEGLKGRTRAEAKQTADDF